MKKIRRMTAMFMAILMMVCSTGMTAFADELPADKSTETDKGVFTDEISVSDTDIIQNDTVSDGDVASDGFERSYSVGNTVTLYMTEQTPTGTKVSWGYLEFDGRICMDSIRNR